MNSARGHNAFTLLEVILALGILAASLAVVGEVTRLSYVNAELASMEGDALLVAESVMSQLVAGLIDPVDTPPTEWLEVGPTGQTSAAWTYSLMLLPTEVNGLLVATVEVEQVTTGPTAASDDPITVKLMRWVLDPEQIEVSL